MAEVRDNIYTEEETREKLLAGVEKACSVIEGAYGAAGGNNVIESELFPGHQVSNDGLISVQNIKLVDPVEQIGANFIKEAAMKAEKDSAEGRKTTMILVKAIVQGIKDAKQSPLEIKRSLDAALPHVLDSIEKQKKEITVKEVASVATIASENEEIGRILQEIYQQIGRDGIVELDNSNLPTTYYEITEGVRLRNAGFLGDYSCTDGKGERAVYENPYVLISKEKITSVDQVENIYKELSAKGINSIVIFADEVELPVATRLAVTHMQGKFKTHIIKQPTLWKNFIVEDFAKVTGATVVDPANGKTFKNLTIDDLGRCEKIVTTADETRVIGIKDISDHIEKLTEENTDESKLRLSWLQTKAAILKVGANSESELSYVQKKARDGISAAYLALQDGVVPGGGIAILNAISGLKNGDSSTAGGKILTDALKAPVIQITKNAGKEPGDILGSVFVPFNTRGLDAKEEKIVDMWEAGILDPAKVVKNAVINAVSIAGTLLTAKRVVTLPRPEKKETPNIPMV